MFRALVLFCLCSLIGVFGDKTVSVSVMEGDSVTLHTEIHEEYSNMLWRYGAKKYNIAEFSRNYGIIYTYDVTDGKFRDRLKLDNQTGSLTITNTTPEHAGVYQLLISGTTFTLKSFNVSVYARLPVPVIISNSSQCSSPSSSSSNCSLVCSVLNVRDVTLSWYKGISVLSNISACDLNQSINLSLPLEVEYQDKNNYSCVVAYSFINRTQHLEINKACHTCAVPPVSVSLIVLISASAAVAGPLMIVVIVVIFCICKKCRKTVNAVQTRQEDRTHSALCKPKTRKKKSKPEGVYENVPKRR